MTQGRVPWLPEQPRRQLPPRVVWRTAHARFQVEVTQIGSRTGRLVIYDDTEPPLVRASWSVALPHGPGLDGATLQVWRAEIADYLRRYAP